MVDVPAVLKAILSSPPSRSDSTLSSAWVQVLGNAMLAYHVTDPEACAAEADKVWKSVWVFLESNDTSTRKAAAEALHLISRCFSPISNTSAIQGTEIGPTGTESALGKIILETTKALDSLAFARSIPELLSVISSLISNLGSMESAISPPFEASPLWALIQRAGDLRIQKGFEYKEAADDTLAVAMRVIGAEALLRILPLNLEPSDRCVFNLYFDSCI